MSRDPWGIQFRVWKTGPMFEILFSPELWYILQPYLKLDSLLNNPIPCLHYKRKQDAAINVRVRLTEGQCDCSQGHQGRNYQPWFRYYHMRRRAKMLAWS